MAEFIAWAEPFGIAGVNSVHADPYEKDQPFFIFHSRFYPRGHRALRAVLYRWESLDTREAYTVSRGGGYPTILDADAFIQGFSFIAFAKAIINVLTEFRELKSASVPLTLAIIVFERAMRVGNNGSNDPLLASHRSFASAARLVNDSHYAQATKYEIGKWLEMIAGMMQSGYHSKSFAGSKLGFRLLGSPFVFSSGIKDRSRPKALEGSAVDDTARVTSEEMAAVGLAYRKSLSTLGKSAIPTFLAAAACLAFTSPSVRIGELLLFRRDTLYRRGEQVRMRIARPKLATFQDVPVAKRMAPLAEEFFECMASHSRAAHEALKFYVKQAPTDFESIHELFIPEPYRKFFETEFMTYAGAWEALRLTGRSPKYLPYALRDIEVIGFIERPGDTLLSPPPNQRHLKAGMVRAACRVGGLSLALSDAVSDETYVDHDSALSAAAGFGAAAIIDRLFRGARRPALAVWTADVKARLLAAFKKRKQPHWPYSTKDRSTRLDEALMVWFAPSTANSSGGNQTPCWWLPAPIIDGTINRWLSQASSDEPPMLFNMLDIKLQDGSYPALTVHDIRKYNQTEALIAGASVIMADLHAGRESGQQSDFYDLRTPAEIVRNSLDAFDPDADYLVIGPRAAMDESIPVRLVTRRAFLRNDAAPKHMHELGGCISDWSLNPCESFGDCMRCGEHGWIKGDVKRFPEILQIRTSALADVAAGMKKLAAQPERVSIKLHLKQLQDVVDRCDEIIAVENDPSIPAGTLVTFAQAPGSATRAQRTEIIRAHTQPG